MSYLAAIFSLLVPRINLGKEKQGIAAVISSNVSFTEGILLWLAVSKSILYNNFLNQGLNGIVFCHVSLCTAVVLPSSSFLTVPHCLQEQARLQNWLPISRTGPRPQCSSRRWLHTPQSSECFQEQEGFFHCDLTKLHLPLLMIIFWGSDLGGSIRRTHLENTCYEFC